MDLKYLFIYQINKFWTNILLNMKYISWCLSFRKLFIIIIIIIMWNVR